MTMLARSALLLVLASTVADASPMVCFTPDAKWLDKVTERQCSILGGAWMPVGGALDYRLWPCNPGWQCMHGCGLEQVKAICAGRRRE